MLGFSSGRFVVIVDSDKRNIDCLSRRIIVSDSDTLMIRALQPAPLVPPCSD